MFREMKRAVDHCSGPPTARRVSVTFWALSALIMCSLIILAYYCGRRASQGGTQMAQVVRNAYKPPEQKHEIPSIRRVRASEIGVSVEIQGRLGHPLGTLVTIRGEWSWPKGDDGPREPKRIPPLVVTAVNGHSLETPVVFEASLVGPLPFHEDERPPLPRALGEVWELRGFEAGGYIGIPGVVTSELYSRQTYPAGGYPWGFYTVFHYGSARVIARGQPTTAPEQRAQPATAPEQLKKPATPLKPSPFDINEP
jgi:hypothetical protein